ncbi:MAG: hypothetical protein H6729_09865 [Deltaproteobacteria bacterium]|nr:hypothetical protein [Deltaproteobacteria bacterium]
MRHRVGFLSVLFIAQAGCFRIGFEATQSSDAHDGSAGFDATDEQIPTTDGATTRRDAATPHPDAATQPDAATPQPDASIPFDAGAEPSDGSTSSDATRWFDDATPPAVIDPPGTVFGAYDGPMIRWGAEGGAGISAAMTNDVSAPRCGFDIQERPIVFWGQSAPNGTRQIYAKRLVDGVWVGLDPANPGGRVSNAPDGVLFRDAIVSGGEAYAIGVGVADGAGRIHHFDKTTWREITEAEESAPVVFNFFDLTATTDGPVLVFDQLNTISSDLYAVRLENSEWVPVGPAPDGLIVATPGPSDGPQIETDSLGRLVVAWSDSSAGSAEVYVLRFDGISWQELGPASARGEGISIGTPEGAREVDLAINQDDRPVVAWREGFRTDTRIFAKEFDGVEWVALGPTSDRGADGISGPQALLPAVTVDAQGRIVILWRTTSGLGGARFESDTWSEVTPLLAHLGGGQSPSFCRNTTGKVMVVWIEEAAGARQIYATWLDTTDPTALGDITGTLRSFPQAPLAHAFGASLSIDQEFKPIIAWSNQDLAGQIAIFAARLGDLQWREAGAGSLTRPGLFEGTVIAHPDLSVDSTNRPLISWAETSTTGAVFVHRNILEADIWSAAGAAPRQLLFQHDVQDFTNLCSPPRFSRNVIPTPAVPVVAAWVCQNIFAGGSVLSAARFEGSAWVPLGVAGVPEIHRLTDRSHASFSVAAHHDGRVLVAWTEENETQDAYVIGSMLYSGSTWATVPTRPDVPGGIAQTGSPGTPGTLQTMFDATGRPHLAWANTSTIGRPQLRVHRLEGGAWQNLGSPAPDASTAASTQEFLLGFYRDQPIVAWEDASSQSSQIYVKTFDGAAWNAPILGLASGGGLTNSEAPSRPRSIYTRDGLVCIVWTEAGSARTEQILMRCLLLDVPPT